MTERYSSKNGKIAKRRRIMYDVVIGLFVVFVFFMISNRFFYTDMEEKQFFNYTDMYLSDTALYARSVLYKHNDVLPWLINYWSEHGEDMNVSRDFTVEDGRIRLNKGGYFDEIDEYLVTLDKLLTYSEEKQKKYAELCYLMTAYNFDFLAKNYNNMFFTCTVPDSESSSEMILILGSTEDKNNSYMLKTPIDAEIREIQTGTEVTLDYEQGIASHVLVHSPIISVSDKINNSFYVVTIPVYDGDKNMIAKVSVGLDDEIVSKEVKKKVLLLNISLIIQLISICVVVIFLIRKKVIKPLETVSDAVQEYIENKNSSNVADNLCGLINMPRKTEMEDLADNIYNMSLEIDEYTEEIKKNVAEKEKKKADMEMASTIQKGQLPLASDEFSNRSEFELFASMNPAKEVGGDFYDFFMIDDDHLALVIADVSDKGVPAALFMMTSKTLIKSELQGGKTLANALSHVNKQLNATNPVNMFVTVWVSVIELSTGNVISINAGHENPVIRKTDGNWLMEKISHDIPVACMPDWDYKEYKWKLEPGEMLFVYTDGVPDASNKNDEQFGVTRMMEALNGFKNETPEAVIREMGDILADFEGGVDRFDDTTMLCIKYKGRNGTVVST